MPPYADPPRDGPPPFQFPELPIVTPDPPRLSTRQKYGGLLYLGLAGLAAILLLLAWFGHGAWAMRDVWRNVYILHETGRSEPSRVQAAYALSRDERLNQRQRWDICLRRPLPALGRYVIAESLTAEAASADPKGYAMAVARSPGWPAWLRLLLTRPMAYAAIEGVKFPRMPLEELTRQEAPAIALWAQFVLAAQGNPEGRDALSALETSARRDGRDRELAALLLDAARRPGHLAEQANLLDRATLWLRTHDPACRAVWKGWRIEGGALVHDAAPVP